MSEKGPHTIQEYIADFSPEIQAKLQKMYSIIREVLMGALQLPYDQPLPGP